MAVFTDKLGMNCLLLRALALVLAGCLGHAASTSITLSGVVPESHDVQIKSIVLTGPELAALGRGESVEIAHLYETNNASAISYEISAVGRSDYQFSLERVEPSSMRRPATASNRVTVLRAKYSGSSPTPSNNGAPVVISIAVR